MQTGAGVSFNLLDIKETVDIFLVLYCHEEKFKLFGFPKTENRGLQLGDRKWALRWGGENTQSIQLGISLCYPHGRWEEWKLVCLSCFEFHLDYNHGMQKPLANCGLSLLELDSTCGPSTRVHFDICMVSLAFSRFHGIWSSYLYLQISICSVKL